MRPLTLLFLAGLGAATGGWRHDRDREAFRALGASAEFAAVGRLEVEGSADRGGSGVLIAPGWVLTAAHVVDRWSPGADYRFAWEGVSSGVADVTVHPGYASAASVDERIDLALVRLEAPVEGIAPMPIHDAVPERGLRVAIVGHGFAQPANTLGANQTPPGVKYAGYNVVDSIDPNHFYIDIDAPDRPELNRLGSAEPDSLEYGRLGGDSGGGVIARIGGEPRLVGINGSVTFTIEHVSEHGWYGLPIRLNTVAPHRRWIDSVTVRSPVSHATSCPGSPGLATRTIGSAPPAS